MSRDESRDGELMRVEAKRDERMIGRRCDDLQATRSFDVMSRRRCENSVFVTIKIRGETSRFFHPRSAARHCIGFRRILREFRMRFSESSHMRDEIAITT